MKLLDWLVTSMQRLVEAGVDSPRRDCMVLLEDLLEKDRSWLNAHAEYKLTKQQVEQLNSWIDRRAAREPLAYIRGKAWFYGRFFTVNKNVLVPRPESENFITILKDLELSRLVDIGTGSGCLIITAKLELPDLKTLGSDIDENALKLAKINSGNYNQEINFIQSDFLSSNIVQNFISEDHKNTAVIANLPYVPENLITSKEITYEPGVSLFSGEDGLSHYREFWKQISDLKDKPKYILCECLEDQVADLKSLALEAGYDFKRQDLIVLLFELV